MILGNSKTFKGTAYVCYLDVLGFSNDILKNWSNRESNPLDKILSIKREMPGFSDIGEDTDNKNHRIYVCRVSTVSDSVTICFGYKDEIIVGDLVLGLESILANISYVWATFVRNGYTIRGAIDFGQIYWDDNELIGPAFINAYRLESEVAKNSRVIVSTSLNGVLADLADKHKSSLTEHLFKRFRKDVDGYIIVDPNILYQSDSQRTTLIEALKKMRDALPTGIVREKYNPLISMLSDGMNVTLKDSDIGAY